MQFILLVILLAASILNAQNPHGVGFKTDCLVCHTTDNWTFDKTRTSFNHDSTGFGLEGIHNQISCVSCHSELNFTNASQDCISCHNDIHQGSVGSDCSRCHNSNQWLVDNIPQIHLENGFELLGAHFDLDCVDCHTEFSNFVFNRIGNECSSCHLSEFNQSEEPNHILSKLSTNCIDCHSPEERNWKAEFFSHEFFPLELGHDQLNCIDCHKTPDYAQTSSNCVDCHLADYKNSINPEHEKFNVSFECAECHTIDPDWQPASFEIHDSYFPIYSGGHIGTWDACLDCHTNSDFTSFGCVQCHSQVETQEQHYSVVGYFYSDLYCITCHPTGEADNLFDHNQTAFPLDGAHLITDCRDCHSTGFQGTPSLCKDCHTENFNNAVEPNHQTLKLSLDCAECHTTNIGWQPALFPNHDQFYPLDGAHKLVENDCAECHSQSFSNTPTSCVGCHLENFQSSSSPDHEKFEFSQECAECHTTNPGWSPASFDHSQYYDLNGAHADIAGDCASCHNETFTNTPTTCVGCHSNDYNSSSNPNHNQAGFPTDCAICHSENSWSPSTFNHDQYYPLTGGHAIIANDCKACHQSGFSNTPTNCFNCHSSDYTSTVSPDHEKFEFSQECTECHTTNPGWSPASFDHSQYYDLNGAHADIAGDCASCHNETFTNTPTTCVGCHQEDFNSSQNPNHIQAGFPTDCAACHSENSWSPSSFNHDQYYPLTGGHAIIANDCKACHQSGFSNTPTDCFDCHRTDYTSTNNPDHEQLNFPQNCASCHSTNPGWSPASFDHNQYFVLNGAHADIAGDCASCHNETFTNTPTTCFGCHANDYNGATNPNHKLSGFSTDCISCHSENAWIPASFNHDDFFQLRGAHAEIANNCASCHNATFTNTPTTCFGCHANDYNGATNPNHKLSGFSTDCASCHSEDTWDGATFDHDNQYFPIFSGKHQGEWNNCNECHTIPGNYSLFSCIDCHEHNNASELAKDHDEVNGYVFQSVSCYACHPKGEED